MVNVEKQIHKTSDVKQNKMKENNNSNSNETKSAESNHDNEIINRTDHLHNVFQDSIYYTLQTTDIDDRIFVSQNNCEKKENTCETNRESEKTSLEKSPLYYGIKSHIHHFYKQPDGKLPKNGEYSQEDDFRFAAEPRRKKIDWLVRIGLWTGVNLMLIGAVSTVVGFLTPQEDIIVGQEGGFAIIDRSAVSFNNRLVLCQVSGLISLACGGIIVVCSLLTLICEARNTLTCPPAVYCVILPPGLVAAQGCAVHPIPLYKTIREVQPSVVGSHY